MGGGRGNRLSQKPQDPRSAIAMTWELPSSACSTSLHEERDCRSFLSVFVGEHCEQDAFDTGAVTKDPHRPGAAPHFTEPALNGIGGACCLAPRVILEAQELEQLVEVLAQAAYRGGVAGLPTISETACRTTCRHAVSGVADAMQVALSPLAIRLADLVEHVAGFVSPATLYRNVGKHRGQGGLETDAAVGDDELDPGAREPPLIEIGQEGLPGRLALGRGEPKVQHFALTRGGDAERHQYGASHRTRAGLAAHHHPIEHQD